MIKNIKNDHTVTKNARLLDLDRPVDNLKLVLESDLSLFAAPSLENPLPKDLITDWSWSEADSLAQPWVHYATVAFGLHDTAVRIGAPTHPGSR